jgi:hypothetical protein
MFNKRQNLVVAIINSDMDAMRVSVPPLRRFGRKFGLVIFNNYADAKFLLRMVRNLGWRRKLQIVNSEKNLSDMDAYIATIDSVRDSKINAEWIMFIGDTDVLIDACVPKVSDDVFAIVQNATTISDSHIDLFKINPAWVRGTDCGKTGPHFEINGTMIRTNVLFEFVDFIRPILIQAKKIIREEKCSPSMAIWEMLNTMMRARHPEMSPIYMNQTNYVAINLGYAGAKRATKNKTSAAMARFRKLAELTVTQNMVAENQ